MKKIVPSKMPTASRKITLMEKGEIVFDVNTESLWVGDGKTPGGLEIGIGVGTVTPVTTVVDANLVVQPGGEYIWTLTDTIRGLGISYVGVGNWAVRVKTRIPLGLGITLDRRLSWATRFDGSDILPTSGARNTLLVDVTNGYGVVSILSIEGL